MMRMPRLFCLLALAGILASATGDATAAARELKVATVRIAPGTEEAASNEAHAIAELNEALMRELCRRLTARCITQAVPFADILPGVETGRFQIAAGNVLRTPEREQRVLFSRTLWRSSSRLVADQQVVNRLRLPDDEVRLAALPAGTRVAAERGTQQFRHLARIAGSLGLTIVESDTVGSAMQALQQNRADFALMPVRSAYFLLARQSGGSYRFVGSPLTEDGLGGTVHLILPKGEAALARELDAALDAMRADGSFQRIIRRYLPYMTD